MKVRYVVLLALAAFLVTTIVQFPSAVVVANINTAPLIINNPAGTVWRGSAQRIQVDANHLDDVQWSVDLPALLTGRIGADIAFELLGGDGFANVSRFLNGDLQLRDGTLLLSAKTISTMIPGQLVQLDGQVDLAVEEWLFRQQNTEALRATLNWKNAALLSPAQAQLGTLTVVAAPHSGGHTLQLENQGGQLAINGKVDIDKRGLYRADVRLTPRANAPAELDSTLGLLGRKGSDGAYRLRQNGRLADFM